jgi:hypothetical protein
MGQDFRILGVPVAGLRLEQAVARGLRGGLVVAPSKPRRGPDYREALLDSKLGPTDRGFEQGIAATEDDCYVAPRYARRGSVQDAGLVSILERRRPPHRFLCVGSRVQEKLGLRLAVGWLVRCIRNPRVFVPRYPRASRLARLILRYDERPLLLVAARR